MVAPILSSSQGQSAGYTAKQLAEVSEIVLQKVLKHNASGTVATNNPPYGPYADGSGDYGVFSIPGIRPEMFSAFSRPRSLSSQIGLRPSLNTNEKIGIMTGVTAGVGSNPTGFCGTAPTGGQLKRCVQNYTFGRSYWKTPIVNVAESGEYVDYADVGKRILNLNTNPNPLIPDIMQRLDISDRSTALLASELFTTGAEMERTLEQVLIKGNKTTANTATQLGWINEFDGLERQVVTGRVDMNTLIACPAADSQVITWGADIGATVSGRTFPQLIVDTMFGLADIAEQAGLAGTRWILVMPFRMFRPLTYVYACQYWTSLCAGSAGNPSMQDASRVRDLQLDMWQRRYLLIDGNPVTVVFSDGITETRAGGSVFTAREMFFLPVEWNGMSTLNLQYKPMDNKEAMDFANFVGPQEFTPINNGMWLATKQRTAYCMELLFAGKMRLILDVPFLAARIDTIQYTFQAPFRSAYPSDTISYVDGGTTRWDGQYKAN